MEALCDQRVLERLEGEERREYGRILLDMVNDQYARMPGTTSISNGGKNISRRIKAIVHFKRYPKGMGLVSWCIVIILLCYGLGASYTAVWGSSKNEKAQAALLWTQDMFMPQDDKQWNRSMAMARINRCTTVAGALDTYAKGLMFENGIYIATASPLDTHEELAKRMKSGLEKTNVARFPWNLDSGFNMEYIEPERGYSILNLTEKEDGSYDALLAFSVLIFYVDEQQLDFMQYEDGSCYTDNTMIIPVNVRYEDAWVVEEVGERIQVLFSREELQFEYNAFPHLMNQVVENDIGITTISAITVHEVKNPDEASDSYSAVPFFGYSTFNSAAILDAEFESVWGYYMADYSCKDILPQPESSIAVRMAVLDEKNREFEFPDERMNEGTGEWGGFVYGYSPVDGNYDGVTDEKWNGTAAAQKIEQREVEEEFIQNPAAFRIQIFQDGVVKEEFTVDGGV